MTTQWSLILSARDDENRDGERALEQLCETYWRPLYAFLRRSGHTRSDAEDLTQSFFAALIERKFLRSVDREKGRFRSFLLASIRHFASKHRARSRALKRGGGAFHFSFDYENGEQYFQEATPISGTPEFEFEVRWALEVLEQAHAQLHASYETKGNLPEYELLSPYLRADTERDGFEALGAALGIGASSARSAVSRLRTRYRLALRNIISQTVDREEDIDDEIRYLLGVLGKS